MINRFIVPILWFGFSLVEEYLIEYINLLIAVFMLEKSLSDDLKYLSLSNYKGLYN
jgi:hypothetical protein